MDAYRIVGPYLKFFFHSSSRQRRVLFLVVLHPFHPRAHPLKGDAGAQGEDEEEEEMRGVQR